MPAYIHEGRLEWFKAQMARLAKRAARIGVPAPSYTLGDPEAREHRDEYGTLRITHHYPVTLTGEAPKFAGWTFAATIERLEGGEVLVRSHVEGALPLRFRAAETASVCEHCNVLRKRNETFVLLHEDGTYKQVGRQCLKDFLGHDAPDDLARMAAYISEALGFIEASESSEDGAGSISIDYYLGYVAACMNAFGWLSRTKAREAGSRGTADEALDHAAPSRALLDRARQGKWKRLEVSADDLKRGADALEWAEDLADAETETSDYLHNLRAIARAKRVEFRTAGYAASIIIAYEKAKDRLRAAQERPVSEYVGTVGVRSIFTVTVRKIVEISGEYGVSYLHLMTDASGNEIKWFGSSRLYFDVGKKAGEGDTVQIKATVKAHQEYKGAKQTMVSRADVYVETPKNTKKNQKIAQGIVDAFTALTM